MIPIEFQNNRVAFLCFNADVLFEQHIRNALFIFYLMNYNSATQGVFVFSFFFSNSENVFVLMYTNSVLSW